MPSRYTQEQVNEIVDRRLREQTDALWEKWVTARLVEFGELNERLQRIEERQRRQDDARRLLLRVWGAAMVVVVPLITALLQHYWP